MGCKSELRRPVRGVCCGALRVTGGGVSRSRLARAMIAVASFVRVGGAISLLALAFCLPVRLEAAIRIWTGTKDGRWSNPTNWAGGIVPRGLDSLEFPGDANVRVCNNDLDPFFDVSHITFTGVGYTLRGNFIVLRGGIDNQASGGTNRVEFAMYVRNNPQTIRARGYFNVLELAGLIDTDVPLTLEARSWIDLSGTLAKNINGSLKQTSIGTVFISSKGAIDGSYLLQSGYLVLSGLPTNTNSVLNLDVGDDLSQPGSAIVSWQGSDRVSNTSFIRVNRSGRLDLNGRSETIGLFNGAGEIQVSTGTLTTTIGGGTDEFSGEIHGTGTYRKLGTNSTLILSGHSPFQGTIDVGAGRLDLTGTASNSVVTLNPGTTLVGSSTIRSLTAAGAVVRPTAGVLRVSEDFSLDADSRLELQLNGNGASWVNAGNFNPGNAVLQLGYDEGANQGPFTLASAGGGPVGANFSELPEGQILLLGTPMTPIGFRISYTGNARHDVVLESIGAVMPPALRVRRLTPAEVMIDWDLEPVGFYLEITPSLRPATWHKPGPLTTTTATNKFYLDAANGVERYYRLVR